MMLNTEAWPKFGYIEPVPGNLIPITIARKGSGISGGRYTGVASIHGRKVMVYAPVKGYLKIWSRMDLPNQLANDAGGWN